MFKFDFQDEIKFTKAVYYTFDGIPLFKVFKDGTGGMGKYAPERGYLELYDNTGVCAHLTIGENFCKTILPLILNGETKSYNSWREEIYWKVRNSGFQSSQAVDVGMLDLMMLDILAQRAEKPLHRFMGATKDWAVAYKGGGSILLEDEELIADMKRYISEGYTTIKFKVGSESLERDVRRVQKVREAVGEDIRIAVDANQKWDVETALDFINRVREYKLAWLEEPIHSHDMNGIKKIKELEPDMELGFGESMRISYAYETYVEKGVTHLQPSVGRMTRMDDLIKIRDLARENKIKFSSGGRIYLNAIFGCLYNEDEFVEYHEPITDPVGEYTLNKPEEKNGRFYPKIDVWGNPIRLDIEKLEKDGLLTGKKIYYAVEK